MRIDGDHPVHDLAEELGEMHRADRLAETEPLVLPHISEVWADQADTGSAEFARRRRCKEQGQELVVRAVQRRDQDDSSAVTVLSSRT
jgi:hypothetical protein